MTTDETTENDSPSIESEDPTGSVRRDFLKAAGTLGGLTALGAFGSTALAANPTVASYLDQSGDVTIPAGSYDWHGSGISVSSGDTLRGDGNPGDVTWNLVEGTMDGYVEGTLSNIVVRGLNQQTKAGIDLYPGATIDGFVWPDGDK